MFAKFFHIFQFILLFFSQRFHQKNLACFGNFLLFEKVELKITLRLFFSFSIPCFFKKRKKTVYAPQSKPFWPISKSLCLRNAKILRIFYLTKVSARESFTSENEIFFFQYAECPHCTVI